MELYRCPKCFSEVIYNNPIQQVFCKNCSSTFDSKFMGQISIVDFSSAYPNEIDNNMIFYNQDAINKYNNYLNWLYKTFSIEELEFRKILLQDLSVKVRGRVLITGCGTGDDINSFLSLSNEFNLDLSIVAQDISRDMIYYSANRFSEYNLKNIKFDVSSATNLPYLSDTFDIVFHFGGINTMSDTKKAIDEMIRVSKNNGQIIFGDESVAPWLRETEYGKMMINNNSLWAADLPVDKFPLGVTSVKVTWILDNCFYLISCIKDANFPKTNLDVEHVGPRGGTIRTRYYGNLEGVTDDVKKLAIKKASSKNLSLSAFLTYLIKNS